MSIYFFVLMLQTLAAAPDRVRLLRSLGVTFGAAFILKFVVLDALADPASGRLARAMQILLEGVTLGALAQELHHPAAGYIAFATVATFLVTLWMLPARSAIELLPAATRSSPASLARRTSDPPV
jgi:hypothetical protein